MTYEKGRVVKYAKPMNKGEEYLRFVVIEDREDRLFVGVVGAPGLGQTECYSKVEYVAA